MLDGSRRRVWYTCVYHTVYHTVYLRGGGAGHDPLDHPADLDHRQHAALVQIVVLEHLPEAFEAVLGHVEQLMEDVHLALAALHHAVGQPPLQPHPVPVRQIRLPSGKQTANNLGGELNSSVVERLNKGLVVMWSPTN
eukprot:1010402-Prorocentrum_minimum.AAC.1